MDLFKNIKVISFLIFCFLFLIIPSQISAQVVINEFSSDSSDDWVELYSDNDTNISGWILRDVKEDGSLSSLKSVFPQNTIIGPSTSSYYIIDLNTRLNKNGDIIKLYSADEAELIDEISYGDKGSICVSDSSQSIGRETDGVETFVRFSSVTKGVTNNGAAQSSCPTPTPTSEPTPTEAPAPTDTPKPTSIPLATKTPTPKPTAKIVNKPTSTPILISKAKEATGQVLGQQEVTGSSPSSGTTKELTQPSLITGAKISLILGLLFCGTAVIVFTQRVQNLKKVDDKT